jgi:hypothetical protein
MQQSAVAAATAVHGQHPRFEVSVQALGSRAWLVLSSCMQPIALQPGHDLCQQGEPAEHLWFLTEGVGVLIHMWSVSSASCLAASYKV